MKRIKNFCAKIRLLNILKKNKLFITIWNVRGFILSKTFEVYVDAELPSECYRINGTAREVVTRMLKHFASDGIIEVTRKGIIISDRKKLRDVAI